VFKKYARWAAYVIVLLIVLLLIFDLGMSLEATCAKHCSIGEGATYGALHSFVEFVEYSEKFLIAFGTLIVAIFTVVLGVATAFLWRATRDLVSAADRTAERQLRAYVMVESVVIEDFGVGRIPKLKITIRNFGLTPVHQLTHWSTVGFDAFPHTVPFPVRDETPLPPMALAPSGKLITRPREQRELNLETWAALAAGTHAIYVIGEIRYEDAFGKRRETDFLLFSGARHIVRLRGPA
jgi:hypothetical protein